MKRRIAALSSLMILALGVNVYPAPLKAPETIPSDKSEITSFDIKLKFDLTEIAAELGNDNIAVGYAGFDRGDYNTRLYDGTPESGTLLATVLTSSRFDGSIDSRDIIDLGLPLSITPQPGHTYTLVCNNGFAVVDQDTKMQYRETALNLKKNPLTFTFHGIAAGSDELIVQKSSLVDNENVDVLKSLIIEYNEEIALTGSSGAVKVFDGEDLIGAPAPVGIEPSNSKAIRMDFNGITLYNGTRYCIRIPEGTVCLKSNPSVVNKAVEIWVNGTSRIAFPVKSMEIKGTQYSLPTSATVRFALEPGQTSSASTASPACRSTPPASAKATTASSSPCHSARPTSSPSTAPPPRYRCKGPARKAEVI